MNIFKKFLIDLSDAEKRIWDLLSQGVVNKRTKFHCPTLSTSKKKKINSRTVILRKVNKIEKILLFYSDKRAKKIDDIKENKNVVVHVYENRYNLQIQLFGKAFSDFNSKHTRNVWETLNGYSKKNYMSKNNPGSYLVGANEVKYYKDENNGYKNFVIISIKIDRIECLQLSREGNQRADFHICLINC